MCDALTGEALGKFWRMWGRDAWRLREDGEEGCWEGHADGAAAFFAETLEGVGVCVR